MRGVDTGDLNSVREIALLNYQARESNRQVQFLLSVSAAISQNKDLLAEAFKSYTELTLPGTKIEGTAKGANKNKQQAAQDLGEAFKKLEDLWSTKE
jgi:hypothetical protein